MNEGTIGSNISLKSLSQGSIESAVFTGSEQLGLIKPILLPNKIEASIPTEITFGEDEIEKFVEAGPDHALKEIQINSYLDGNEMLNNVATE